MQTPPSRALRPCSGNPSCGKVFSHCIASPQIPLEEYECRKVRESVHVAAGSLQAMNFRLIGGIVDSVVRISVVFFVRVRFPGTDCDRREAIFLIEMPLVLECVRLRRWDIAQKPARRHCDGFSR
jgi:hypothetical protein